MMKLVNKFSLIGLMALGAVACVDNDPEYQQFASEAVDFTYNVEGDQYLTDYYVVSTIEFNNISSEKGTCTWNFGDGTTLQSNDPVVSHKYAQAGNYEVTLTIDGVGSRTYPLMIADITPKLFITEQTDPDMVEVNKTSVAFGLSLPNPEGLKVKYEWIFPEGSMYADGTEIPNNYFEGKFENGETVYPPQMVKFKHIGSQQVLIRTYFDVDGENRRLTDSYLNVQVAANVEAPTLYYAAYKGNIKALKLIESDQLPEGTKVLPYDMGVSAGEMPYQLCYGETAAVDSTSTTGKQGWIYILDAGKQYIYSGAPEGAGDGKITAMRVDGTDVNTVISSVGGHAYNDPYHGCVVGERLYYTDRNEGVRYIDQTKRGQQESAVLSEGSYLVKNSWIGYYGAGLSYGAIHTGILQDSKGMWWWGKTFNGFGIYRFFNTPEEVNQTKTPSLPPYPVLLNDINIKAFAIDEQRNAVYAWCRTNGDGGFRKYTMPATNTDELKGSAFDVKVFAEADPINTSADEGIHTTQFAIDNTTGRVYFCYRPAAGVTEAVITGAGITETKVAVTSGIYYYDPEGKTIVKYGETDDQGIGCVINPTLSKLF